MNNYWDMYEPDVVEYYDTPLRDFDCVEKQRLQNKRDAGVKQWHKPSMPKQLPDGDNT